MNFNSETWIAICFISFFILTIKMIYKKLDSFFIAKEKEVECTILNSMEIFEAAKNHLYESKKMIDEIEDYKKIAFSKEQMEIEYDIKNKEDKLARLIEAKKSQINVLIHSEVVKFKNETYQKLHLLTKENANKIIDNNPNLYKQFTDVKIEKSNRI